ATDRETKAGAAVFSRCPGVGLLEGLKDQLLLFCRNPHAGILYGESDHMLSLAECRMIDAPALCRQVDPQRDVASRCELEGVRQKILQDLLKTLCVALDAMGKLITELNHERQVLRLGDVPERAHDIMAQTAEGYLLNFESNRT